MKGHHTTFEPARTNGKIATVPPGKRSLNSHPGTQRITPLPKSGDPPKTPKVTEKEDQCQQPERTQKPAKHPLSIMQSLPPSEEDIFHTSDLLMRYRIRSAMRSM